MEGTRFNRGTRVEGVTEGHDAGNLGAKAHLKVEIDFPTPGRVASDPYFGTFSQSAEGRFPAHFGSLSLLLTGGPTAGPRHFGSAPMAPYHYQLPV